VEHVSTLLAEVDSLLEDGRKSILGGDKINYSDIAFAAIMGLWMQPEGYGGGKADTVRIERDRVPAAMRNDIEKWEADYPRACAFIEALYRLRR
jgi:glutathione S-transferase